MKPLKRHLTRLASRGEAGLAYAFDAWRSPAPDQLRVMIFAQGRTGSTLLEELLCSTGHFRSHGELFNTAYRAEVRDPARFLRGRANMHPRRHFLFHLKLYQLSRTRRRPLDPTGFLADLDREGWRIIYLRRDNLLLHVLSNLITLQRRSPIKTDDQDEGLRLTVDCDELVDRVHSRQAFAAGEQEALRGVRDYATVRYERDLADAARHQATVDTLLAHLALPPRPAQTALRKINTRPLSELIVNYDEFLACVHANGWSHFLPDDA